jgi:Flp pilus assembly protein TadD
VTRQMDVRPAGRGERDRDAPLRGAPAWLAVLVAASAACGGSRAVRHVPKADQPAPAAPAAAAPVRATRASPTAAASAAAAVSVDASVPELRGAAAEAMAGRDFASANELLGRALAKEPKNGELLFATAWVAEQQGRTDQASAAYKKALEAEPGQVAATLNLARLRRLEERFVDGEQLIRQALGKHDGDPRLLVGLASLLRLERRFDEAEDLVRKALAGRAEDASSFNALALIQLDRGRLRLAEAALATAHKLDERDPSVLNNQGLLALRRDDPATARARFQDAVALDPSFTTGWANLGALALSYRDYGAAADAYAKATAAEPARWELQLALAWSLEGQKKPAEARAAFERVLALKPGQDDALYGQALALRAEGDLQRAMDKLKAYVRVPQASRAQEAQKLIAQIDLRLKNPPAKPPAPEARREANAKAGDDISKILPGAGEAGTPSANLPQDLPVPGVDEPMVAPDSGQPMPAAAPPGRGKGK